MTLKTSLIISGDSSGATKAVDELVAKLDGAKTAAGGAAAPMAQLDQAQGAVATSAREVATAAGQQDDAQRKGAGTTRDLAQALDIGKVAHGAVAAAAREATGVQTAYAQSMAEAADQGRKLSAANDDVAGGVGAVAEQLGVIQKAQGGAAIGADAHSKAIEGLQGEIKGIVAQITGGATVFDAMADRGGAVAAALQKVADASGVATAGIDATGKSGEAAGVDVGGLTDSVRDAAGQVENTGSKFSAVAGILGGPWGAAIGIATNLLLPFIAGLIEGANQQENMTDAIARGVEQLKEDARQSEINAQAKAIFASSIEGVTAAIHDSTAATTRAITVSRTAAEQTNIEARQKLNLAVAIREATKAGLADEEARLRIQISRASGSGQSSEIAALSLGRFQQQLAATRTALAGQDALILEAQQAVERSQIALAAEQAKLVDDGVAGINRKYDLEIARLNEVKDKEIARGNFDDARNRKEFKAIERRRNADLATEREREQAANRKPPKARVTSIGSQVQGEQASNLLALALQYKGLSENRPGDRDQLKDLFAKANGKIVDPKITAWCAAFVNAVLATDGIKGTGSLSARSFLNYGEATSKPNQGDIVVSKRGNDPAQGHVGFYQGTDAKGRVLVLGGNTGDKVGTSAIDRSNVLGFRRAPTASTQYSAEVKAAADAQKQLAQDIAQVTQRYLPATQAAKDYADELERIERLAKSYDPAKAGSGLSPEDATRAKAAITAVRDKRLADLALTPEAKAADEAKKSIDGVIASLQQEIAVRQAASPVDAAMIAHRRELAELAKGDPSAAAARETALRDTYAQRDAIDAVEEATRAAAQAQEQFRNLALDAFEAIVIGGQNAGDVIKHLAQTIAQAAIEASVFGTGPLAALLRGGGSAAGAPGGSASAAGIPGTQQAADVVGKTLSKSIGDRLDKVFGNGGSGKALQYAGFGYAAGNVTGGSGVGGSIGGLLGGEVAKKLLSSALGSFAGPLGSIAGGILGGVVGKLFAKPTTGAAVITSASAPAQLSGKVGAQLGGDASGVQSSLQQIAQQLGGELGAFSVAIGKRNDYFRVSASGNAANTTNKHYGSDIIYDGKDEATAVAVALKNAIQDGAVKGLSAAVTQAINSSSDVQAALKEALKVQDVELMIGGIGAEIDKAFKNFETTAAERVRIAQQYGFDVVAIEKRNADDRLKLSSELLKKQVGGLQSLIDEITQGSLFEGNALDKIAALNTAIAKAKTDVDAGVEGAGDTLANLYSQRLTAAKDAYGTTSGYSDARTSTLDEARAAVAKANARINQANGTKTSDPALVTTNAALDENNDQNARIIAALEQNTAVLAGIAQDRNDYSPRYFNLEKLAAV